MKINKYFPKLKIGYTLDIVDCNDDIQKGCKVLRIWYPKEGDTWSEIDEVTNLGWLHSASEDLFPQILIETPAVYGLYTLTGDDAEKILNVYYKNKLIKRKLYYEIKSK